MKIFNPFQICLLPFQAESFNMARAARRPLPGGGGGEARVGTMHRRSGTNLDQTLFTPSHFSKIRDNPFFYVRACVHVCCVNPRARSRARSSPADGRPANVQLLSPTPSLPPLFFFLSLSLSRLRKTLSLSFYCTTVVAVAAAV